MTVTALLLNYKRPKNLQSIIESLKNQSIKVNIFLWNNNNQDFTNYDVDLQINSSVNLMCSPRWIMSGYCKSDYVFSLDDDLLPINNNIIEECINYSEKEDCAIGYEGVVLNKDKQYWASKHLRATLYKDMSVDVIKGRFLFLRRDYVKCINWLSLEKRSNYRIEDDIIISSSLSNKILPSFLYKNFYELPQPYALFKNSDHKESRQESIYRYFKC